MPEKFKFQMESMFLVLIFSNLAQRDVFLSSWGGHWCQQWSPVTALQLPKKDLSPLRAEDILLINSHRTSLMLNAA